MTYLFKLLAASILLFFSLTELAAAQNGASIRGEVVSTDGVPLPGVHLLIPELETGTFSDQQGHFLIEGLDSGEYTLIASMVGFRDTELTVNLEPGMITPLNIELSPIAIISDELVVTASRRSQLAGKVPVSISTISPAELESRNIVTLEEALHHVPGVQVTGNQVNIRGSSGYAYGVGSRVLLLVDGVPLLGPDQGNMDFDGLPLSNIRQIEVLKSPGSALYGGGALGGVINLITNDYPDEPESNVRLYSGLYQPVRYEEWRTNRGNGNRFRTFTGGTVSHSRKTGNRFGYWATGTFRSDSGYLESNSLLSGELYGKAGLRFSGNQRLDLYTGIRRTRQEQFLYWKGLDDVLSPGSVNLGGEEAVGSNLGLSDRITILPVFNHTVHPDFHYTVKARLFGVAFRPIDSRGNIRPRERHTEGLRYGFEGQFNSSPHEHVEVTGGGTFDANWVSSEFYIGEDSLEVRNQPEGALFLQVDTGWIPEFMVSAGFRYDIYRVHTQDLASQFSPKLGISFELTDHITVRGSFGRGFRIPSVAERFVSNREFLPLESNITLQPETSTGYEAGISSRHRLGSKWGIRTDVTGFLNHYRNLVEPQFSPQDGAFRFVNLTQARIRGMESTLNLFSRESQTDIQISYTWLDAQDTGIGQPLLFRSEHLFQSSARTFLNRWLETGFDFRMASSPKRVDTDFSRFVSDADQFPAVAVADARILFHPELHTNATVTCGIHLKNLFDYYYVERPAFFAAPRSIQAVLNIRF